MKNKIPLLAVLPLFALSGCWQAGTSQYVGIVTKVAHIGAVFETTEAEIHLVDAKGTMVADSIELSVDDSSEHGEKKSDIIAALKSAQESGTRVRITTVREVFVGPWRAVTNRLVTKVEMLP